MKSLSMAANLAFKGHFLMHATEFEKSGIKLPDGGKHDNSGIDQRGDHFIVTTSNPDNCEKDQAFVQQLLMSKAIFGFLYTPNQSNETANFSRVADSPAIREAREVYERVGKLEPVKFEVNA